MFSSISASVVDSMNLNLFLIRHCESSYNQIYQSYLKQNKSKLQIEEEIQYNEKFIDCGLTEKGVKQAITMRRKLKDKQVGTIFVSPYLRTLQTCKIMFEDHPDRPQVIVHPSLGEQIGWACDISKYNGKAFSGFENYNWGYMPCSQQLKEYWLLKRKKGRKQVKELVQNSCDFNQLTANCCKLMKHQRKNILAETKDDIIQRSEQSKSFLAEMKEIYEQPFYIVSHCSFLVNFTTYFNEKLGNQGYDKFLNGECKEFCLQI